MKALLVMASPNHFEYRAAPNNVGGNKMKKLFAALALALALVGCGSSGSDSGTKTTTTRNGSPSTTDEAPKLEPAVRAYTAAFLGGDDAGAYDVLSDRCHGEMAQAKFKSGVDQGSKLYGDATITSYDEKLNGNTATATYELSDPSLNQTNERWILEDGAWHNDDC